MADSSYISKELSGFYNNSSEEDRLTQGLGPLEFERNKELIQRFVSKDKSNIVDVGGGTGKYSEWLANKGHKLTLIDPIQKHIDLAKKRATRIKNSFEAIIGEARNIDLPDNYADVVILHGPLYHLQDYVERAKAIAEARRIVKTGGVILGFAINYTASTLVALMQGLIYEPAILNMCRAELETGIHNAPEGMPGILADAYYHRPEELRKEFKAANLQVEGVFAVEGITWLEKNYFTVRGDKNKFKTLLDINGLVESEPSLLGVSPHIMVAAIK